MSSKTIIFCEVGAKFKDQVETFAAELREEAHTVGSHGLSEDEFYNSGLFQAAVQRLRGQIAATMEEKRAFISAILDHLRDSGYIASWESVGSANRHDYRVDFDDGRIAVIEAKGCLDGNNTTIYERPPHANEFIIWSLCQNPGSNLRKGVWSGLHTRLSPEIIDRRQVVDGLIVWDFVCATAGRVCPKVENAPERLTEVGNYKVPPPCIYILPSTVPSPRNNPEPPPQILADVRFLNVLSEAFGCRDEEITQVSFLVAQDGQNVVRTTKLVRDGKEVAVSKPTAIRRA